MERSIKTMFEETERDWDFQQKCLISLLFISSFNMSLCLEDNKMGCFSTSPKALELSILETVANESENISH